MSKYRWLLRYPMRQWPVMVLIVALTAGSSAVAVLQPWPMKMLVDYALGGVDVPARLRSLLGAVSLSASPPVLVVAAAAAGFALFLLYDAFNVGLSWCWTAAGQRMVYDLAGDLFHRLQRLSLRFHSRRPVGDSLSRLMDDTYCAYAATDGLLISPGQNLIALVLIGTVAWRLDSQLTGLALAMAPLMAGSALFFGRRLKRRARRNREDRSRLLTFVHQTLTAIPLVQAFGAEERNRREFQRLAADAVSSSQRGIVVQKAYGFVNEAITTAGTAVVLYFGGRRVLSGALTLGSLLVFLAYLRSLEVACRGLLGTYGNLKSIDASIDRVKELFDAEDRVREPLGAQPMPSLPGPRRGAAVRLEGVTFGYEPGRPVLHEVDVEASPGETIALVGSSGAGKSTLVSLLPRFFDPWEGRVSVDGLDVRGVQLASLRSRIAILLQDPFLLPLTVAENIAYGRAGASAEDIAAAAAAANADAFIRRLPRAYDTVVGERGATLSGGEQQRIAIARALLKDAPLLILDEPTSALDAQTEALLLQALQRLMEGRTTVMIAHRLSTLRDANRIVVIDAGRVVETGTHRELMAAHGRFHHLYQLQLAASKQEGGA